MAKSKAPARSSGIFDLLGVGNEAPAAPSSAAPREKGDAAASGIVRIPLAQLRLDLAQPRRPLPVAYATKVNSSALTLVQAVERWAKDTGVPLSSKFDAESKLGAGAARALDELRRELAAPILDVGLINPISVVDGGDGHYTIETGERRALAHAYLVASGHAEFCEIPAQVVERGEIARRQFEENEARQDLTAVQKARLWWSTRYRLSGLGRIDWSKFESVDNLNAVLGAEDKGELAAWTKVEQKLKRTKQMRIYNLRVFDMPAEAIRLAEEYGLSEKVLRPILEQFASDPVQQIKLVREEAQRHETGEASSAQTMAKRIAAKAGGANAKRGVAAADESIAYKRAFSAFDKLTGGKTIAARDVKRLSEALGEDESIVEAARRLKPLIDRLAGA